jgi:phage-related protein
MQRPQKPLEWIGSARRELKNFPPLARQMAGSGLSLVQDGREPEDWKPLDQVGPGARELRVRTFEGGSVQHRVVYVAKFPEAVYVLHAFEKKTEKTPPHHIEVAASRYRELLRRRRAQHERKKGSS